MNEGGSVTDTYTYDAFSNLLKPTDSETVPEEGELCRIRVTLDFDEYEYLYFDFPKNEMNNEK